MVDYNTGMSHCTKCKPCFVAEQAGQATIDAHHAVIAHLGLLKGPTLLAYSLITS